MRWDPDARVTSVAGLAHFGAFLANVGLFDRMAEDAPFDYRSNNACSKRDIFGTAVLGILLGKTRYVHINELRHDSAAKALLARDKIVSEDTVRRAFRNADEKKLDAWARERRLLFIRRPVEKKIEVIRTKPRKTKVPSEESRALVPSPHL